MIKRMVISIMLIAGVAVADNLRTDTLTVSYDATNAVQGATWRTNLVNGFKGVIQEVQVSASSAAGTGTYSLVYTPLAGTTAQTIASGTAMATATKIFRPYVFATDTAGVALTNSAALGTTWVLPVPFTLIGEKVAFAVTNVNSSVSNVTYTAVIKYYKME